jgi:hypothetical protein
MNPYRSARRNPLLCRRGYTFQHPLYRAVNNRKRQLPSCKTRAAAEQADEPDLAIFLTDKCSAAEKVTNIPPFVH